MNVCLVLLLWQPEEQSPLKEVQLAQRPKELDCSKPKQASDSSVCDTKLWSVASSLGMVYKLIQFKKPKQFSPFSQLQAAKMKGTNEITALVSGVSRLKRLSYGLRSCNSLLLFLTLFLPKSTKTPNLVNSFKEQNILNCNFYLRFGKCM